ncbi:YncE family protein [Gaopeijia maritima]|uniref:YncE family protein n=1 Tax=Gaopeijia maritima TaxID=3119007 RepID=A0ABU9E9R5_9BACT
MTAPIRSGSLLALLMAAGCGGAPAGGAAAPSPTAGAAASSDAVYYAYVGAESADLMHRVRLGPDGASIDRTIPVGELAVENEGPHGFATSPDGRFIYMTTGHGVPDGKLWKFDAGADTLVADPILLGWFPATMDLTPDGLYALIVNFNLHGEMVPSTVSVVYTPDMIEVDQIETCVMPHGLRMEPSGVFAYSNCMMDDLMVEIDTRTFEVSRRFSVAVGEEGPAESMAMDHSAMGMDHSSMEMGGMQGMSMDPSCSPTWAEPSADGTMVYVACNKGDRILEVDRAEWSLKRVFETGRGPYNLDVTPDGRLLVATLKQGAGVEFFDLESGASLGSVPSTTTVTHGVVISPDSRYAFVSVEGVGAEPGKVDIYDLADLEQVASLEVGQQAGGITFWKMEPAPSN